jgi:phosphoketolase
MKSNTLTPELLQKMDGYWHAANYLSVGQIFLYDNPPLKRPLTLADVKNSLRQEEIIEEIGVIMLSAEALKRQSQLPLPVI